MKIQAVRGMQDMLPEKQEVLRHVADCVRDVFTAYGYREVGLPVLESTDLFKRLVGESTDIVEKEMYTFEDRNGDSVTMRPEGTAGCVRLAQQGGLTYNQVQRLWYGGPMFRYERPQKGRYRQFEQMGAECFGMAGPDIDAELLLMLGRLWQSLGLADGIMLELNSMGSADARAEYRKALVEFLTPFADELDEDSRRRLTTNPLRILDSKVERTRELLEGAPVLNDFLDEESKRHFDELRGLLDRAQMPYKVNPRIVRGLDYYNSTVFEFVTDTLGAQGTVCAGGRYDGLVEELGGKPTPAVGFAIGLERLALMLEESFNAANTADIYVASIGDSARNQALLLAERVRDAHPGRRVVVHCGEGKFKAQLKRADASGAEVAVILGEDELARDEVTVKLLRESGEQASVPVSELNQYLDKVFKE
jgi:histidyl-tRNA synthetase